MAESHARDRGQNSGDSPTAIDYSRMRWEALTRYADNRELPIDNTPDENAFRAICPGKKNWLFTESKRSGNALPAFRVC